MDQTLVKRLFELRFEIQELEREGRQYVAKAHPSPYERLLQDKRIRRLEDIKSELESLAAGHVRTDNSN